MLTLEGTASIVIEVTPGVFIDCGLTHIDVRSLQAFRAGWCAQPWREEFARPHPRCVYNANALIAWQAGRYYRDLFATWQPALFAIYQHDVRHLVREGERVPHELPESVLADVLTHSHLHLIPTSNHTPGA